MFNVDDIKDIVVATDFSETAGLAVESAVQIAKTYGAKLHVIHAFETPVPIVSPYEIVMPEGLLEQARTSAMKSLQAARQKAEAAGVKAEAHLTEAPSAHAIARYAANCGADLVVVGTRGHTGLKHVLLGSVAERTVREAPCPVLVIKGKAEAKPRSTKPGSKAASKAGSKGKPKAKVKAR
jgi:nucleotide-binding universal stress UspA family protein